MNLQEDSTIDVNHTNWFYEDILRLSDQNVYLMWMLWAFEVDDLIRKIRAKPTPYLYFVLSYDKYFPLDWIQCANRFRVTCMWCSERKKKNVFIMRNQRPIFWNDWTVHCTIFMDVFFSTENKPLVNYSNSVDFIFSINAKIVPRNCRICKIIWMSRILKQIKTVNAHTNFPKCIGG